MSNTIINRTGSLTIPSNHYLFTNMIFSLYKNFNKEHFSDIEVEKPFLKFVKTVVTKHNQKCSIKSKTIDLKVNIPNNKKVVLGFSAGLDSCFQALRLKKKGYDVSLFFVKNLNTYENGQALKAAYIFSEKTKIPLVVANFKKNFDKDNPYRQYWAENPIKNQLILAMMCDYCVDNDISNISLGDDFSLGIDDAVVGTNVTDAKEVTKTFLKGLSKLCNINFIPINKKYDKGYRLEFLKNKKLLDTYYSCVSPGRFNKKLHTNNILKYNVKDLPNYNCGSCRKCALHWLLLKNLKLVKKNKEFEKHCWEILYNTKYNADAFLFSPNIPKKQRIKNLFEY